MTEIALEPILKFTGVCFIYFRHGELFACVAWMLLWHHVRHAAKWDSSAGDYLRAVTDRSPIAYDQPL